MIDPGRADRYEHLYAQLWGLIEGQSPSLVAAMATVCAVLHGELRHHWWTGFYFVAGPDELHVGPYQGPVACQVLRGRGVCLHCANTRQPVVVADVGRFPGHIACDPRSQSEIALPVFKDQQVVAVFDIDSDQLAQFDEDDVSPLMRILALLRPYL